MANQFEFAPRFEFFEGEPQGDFWTAEMQMILRDTMCGLTKKKQQVVYQHILALMHMFYRMGYARGCHAGAGDVLNYKGEDDAMPLDFGTLFIARQALDGKVADANQADQLIQNILASIDVEE